MPLNDNRTLCTSSCDEFQIKVNQDCFFDNPPDLECSNTDLFIDRACIQFSISPAAALAPSLVALLAVVAAGFALMN